MLLSRAMLLLLIGDGLILTAEKRHT